MSYELSQEEKALLSQVIERNIVKMEADIRYLSCTQGKRSLHVNRYKEEVATLRNIRLKLNL